MSAAEPNNFSWLEENILAASAFPDKIENIQFLVDNNVGVIVSLTGEKQVDLGHLKSQIKAHWIPIQDYTPPTLEQVRDFIDTVIATRASNKATLVHCAHGLGRTGTMLSCYFVKVHGMSPDEAIAHVRKLRPGSVETAEQEYLVSQFAETILGEKHKQ